MNKILKPNYTFSVAPMMEWTDRHYRALARIITKHTLLYTEMVTAPALYFGDVDKHLKYNNDIEHPIAVQLGGSNIEQLATATKHCHDYGYDEVNLNVGCPSDRVQNGKIGAILMREPELVAQCLSAMADNTDKPITVKHRIGLNDDQDYDIVKNFIETVANNSPCKTFIVHARVAKLKGLSPKENRDVPPLKYDFVHQAKKDFPELNIIINGGIADIATTQEHLNAGLDGVMVGRSAYNTPYDMLSTIDRDIFGDDHKILSRREVLIAYLPYIEKQLSEDVYLGNIMKHTMGIFHGQIGGKQYRRILSENMHKKGAGLDVIMDALAVVE